MSPVIQVGITGESVQRSDVHYYGAPMMNLQLDTLDLSPAHSTEVVACLLYPAHVLYYTTVVLQYMLAYNNHHDLLCLDGSHRESAE
jgi:hypothetical protein